MSELHRCPWAGVEAVTDKTLDLQALKQLCEEAAPEYVAREYLPILIAEIERLRELDRIWQNRINDEVHLSDRRQEGLEHHEARADRLQALLNEATEHLNKVVSTAIWMSGSRDFSPSGPAGEAWERNREDVFAAMGFLSRLKEGNPT